MALYKNGSDTPLTSYSLS